MLMDDGIAENRQYPDRRTAWVPDELQHGKAFLMPKFTLLLYYYFPLIYVTGMASFAETLDQ